MSEQIKLLIEQITIAAIQASHKNKAHVFVQYFGHTDSFCVHANHADIEYTAKTIRNRNCLFRLECYLTGDLSGNAVEKLKEMLKAIEDLS